MQQQTWTEEEVTKLYLNSRKFETYGKNMEKFLSSTGFLNKQSTLNDAINNYCEQLNVPDEIKVNMHILRKNRNLAVHESIKSFNKQDVLSLDYYKQEQIEHYQTFYKKITETTNVFMENLKQSQQDDEPVDEWSTNTRKLQKRNTINQIPEVAPKFTTQYDPKDQTEMWKRIEVKKFFRNATRFKTYGMNMEHFLLENGFMNKSLWPQEFQSYNDIFGGIEYYCKIYSIPKEVKNSMHRLRLNRNLDAHEGTTQFEKSNVLDIDYYDSKQIEKYQWFQHIFNKIVRQWRIMVLSKKGISKDQIKTQLRNKQLERICKKGVDCRNNSCTKQHPQKKYCQYGNNCPKLRSCAFCHSKQCDVFVRYLNKGTITKDLESYLENYGPLGFCTVFVAKSGMTFGKATFNEFKDCKKCLKERYHELSNKRIKVDPQN